MSVSEEKLPPKILGQRLCGRVMHTVYGVQGRWAVSNTYIDSVPRSALGSSCLKRSVIFTQ